MYILHAIYCACSGELASIFVIPFEPGFVEKKTHSQFWKGRIFRVRFLAKKLIESQNSQNFSIWLPTFHQKAKKLKKSKNLSVKAIFSSLHHVSCTKTIETIILSWQYSFNLFFPPMHCVLIWAFWKAKVPIIWTFLLDQTLFWLRKFIQFLLHVNSCCLLKAISWKKGFIFNFVLSKW